MAGPLRLSGVARLARVGGQERDGADGVPRAWGQGLLFATLLVPSSATHVALRGHRERLDVSGPGPKGREREGPGVLQPARGHAALGGVALRCVGARGRLPLQLREFRVDGAQTPLTGHLLPPPTTRGHSRPRAVCSSSVSHRWMECGNAGPPSPPAWCGVASPSREIVW